MDKPCCVGIVRSADGLKGSTSKVGDLDVYATAANAAKKNNVGVVVIHDIFGAKIPNCKYIVDHLAELGYTAVMPDFYRGDCWPEGKEFDETFGPWIGGLLSEESWTKFTKDATAVAEHLKAQGCTKLVSIGFCWGGKAAAMTARTGLFSAAVSCHGVAHGADDITEAKCPILYLTVTGDDYFPEAKHEEVRKAQKEAGKGGDVKVFDGLSHGFIVRGDFANDANLKAKADEAMGDAVAFFASNTA
eukprot:GFYU01008648.1.p1 GENE.GFYU01008648.1~~GFYU01008648.1.p1  ORF type:complete len:263 (-),score=87.21 GFYU01008648.1:187-924(-)